MSLWGRANSLTWDTFHTLLRHTFHFSCGETNVLLIEQDETASQQRHGAAESYYKATKIHICNVFPCVLLRVVSVSISACWADRKTAQRSFQKFVLFITQIYFVEWFYFASFFHLFSVQSIALVGSGRFECSPNHSVTVTEKKVTEIHSV